MIPEFGTYFFSRNHFLFIYLSFRPQMGEKWLRFVLDRFLTIPLYLITV